MKVLKRILNVIIFLPRLVIFGSLAIILLPFEYIIYGEIPLSNIIIDLSIGNF